jgi:hypothetical protein
VNAGSGVPWFLPTQYVFFKHTVLERELGDQLLELADLIPQLRHIAAIGLALGIADQALLARIEELFAPGVVEVSGDAFAPAEFTNAGLATQAFEDDADLVFG